MFFGLWWNVLEDCFFVRAKLSLQLVVSMCFNLMRLIWNIIFVIPYTVLIVIILELVDFGY